MSKETIRIILKAVTIFTVSFVIGYGTVMGFHALTTPAQPAQTIQDK